LHHLVIIRRVDRKLRTLSEHADAVAFSVHTLGARYRGKTSPIMEVRRPCSMLDSIFVLAHNIARDLEYGPGRRGCKNILLCTKGGISMIGVVDA